MQVSFSLVKKNPKKECKNSSPPQSMLSNNLGGHSKDFSLRDILGVCISIELQFNSYALFEAFKKISICVIQLALKLS